MVYNCLSKGLNICLGSMKPPKTHNLWLEICTFSLSLLFLCNAGSVQKKRSSQDLQNDLKVTMIVAYSKKLQP